jgi:hypothetical protein
MSRSRIALALFAFITLFFVATPARAEGWDIDLYTIGYAPNFYSRFGHSIFCVRDAGTDVALEKGICYDYGVADREDFVHVFWTSVRGESTFVAIAVEEKVALDFFKAQGRRIERQRLPLEPDDAERLATRLDEDARQKRSYAYHPYWANCSTQLRDRLDRVTGGKLRAGPSSPPRLSFRELMEDGHAGHAAELFGMTLFLGGANDRIPSAWESMYLPVYLRDGVADRFGAKPIVVHDGPEKPPPTRMIGRSVTAILGAALAAVVLGIGRTRRKLALMIAGGVLGVLAVTTAMMSALVVYPEIVWNAALLVLLPTDLALPTIAGRAPRFLPVYVKLRLVMAVVCAVLAMAGVFAQPLVAICLLVALPMAAIVVLDRRRALTPARAPAAVTT